MVLQEYIWLLSFNFFQQFSMIPDDSINIFYDVIICVTSSIQIPLKGIVIYLQMYKSNVSTTLLLQNQNKNDHFKFKTETYIQLFNIQIWHPHN